MFAEVSGIHNLESTVGHEIYHNVWGCICVGKLATSVGRIDGRDPLNSQRTIC